MSIGRPLEFNRHTVLDAAMRLFWRQGYEATSVQALLDGMKLSKSSLYQAFGSKRGLFLQCIERYHDNTMSQMQDRLGRVDTGLQFIAETLTGVIQEVNELANPRGCLVTNTATEFAQSDPEIAAIVSNGLSGYRSMFCQAVVKGQSDGSVRGDFTPEELADYLVTNMSGLRTMVKAGTAAPTLRKMVDMIVSTVQ